MSRLAAANWPLFVVLWGSAACGAARPVERLAVQEPSTRAPKVRRVPVTFGSGGLLDFIEKEATIVLARDPPEEESRVAFANRTTPFENFIYDPEKDRFVVPSFWALTRSGTLTFAPPPLTWTGPVPLPDADLRRISRDAFCDVILAAHMTQHDTVLLCTSLSHAFQPEAPDLRDVVVRVSFDAGSAEVRARKGLAIARGWDATSMLWEFLATGRLFVAVEGNVLERRVSPARHPTLRIDAGDEVHVLSKRTWHSATVTDDGRVVGVTRSAGRASLHGLDGEGQRRFHVPLRDAGIVARHSEGVCVREGVGYRDATIECFDRQGLLRWRRTTTGRVRDWMVDDDGWIYLVQDGRGERKRIVAVSPSGSIVWSFPAGPPHGGLVAVDDDLCFVSEVDNDGRGAPPELVCIGPRHGARSLPSTNTPRAGSHLP